MFIDPGTPQWQIGPEGLAAEGVWSEIAARVCGAIGRIAALQGRPVVGSIQSSLACRLVECRWVFPLQDLLDSWAASNFGLPFKGGGTAKHGTREEAERRRDPAPPSGGPSGEAASSSGLPQQII